MPASFAAESRLSVPSVRSRLVCANVSAKRLKSKAPASEARLVDDRVRPGLEHHPTHGVPVEHVEQGRLGAELAQRLRPLLRP
jgi:hypothetical protein